MPTMTAGHQAREARVADIPRLVELLLRMDAHVAGVTRSELKPNAAGRREMEDRFRALIDNPDGCVVVVTDGHHRIIAMGDVQIWRYADLWHNHERRGRAVAVVDDVWVEPRHRRRGISRCIIETLVTFATRHGVEHLMLEYSLSNPEAQGAWTRLGFEPTGVRAEATAATVLARLGASGGVEDAY